MSGGVPAGELLPDTLPGHWDGSDGAVIARSYAQVERSDLCKGDLSDMGLANEIWMASRNSLDLIVWQDAAKNRIRWLSAQLAVALATPTPPSRDADVERVQEALAPFAWLEVPISAEVSDDAFFFCDALTELTITVGQVRAARAALQALGERG